MLASLICPVSAEKIDKNVTRIGATLTSILLGIYAYTGIPWILAYVVLDYVVRVFLPTRRPPIGMVALGLARLLKLGSMPMGKAPKIFAWRVGFLFALASLLLYPAYPQDSIFVALALLGFNVLDGVFNFCVGCVMYTYVTLPLMNYFPRTRSSQ